LRLPMVHVPPAAGAAAFGGDLGQVEVAVKHLDAGADHVVGRQARSRFRTACVSKRTWRQVRSLTVAVQKEGARR
jgi:hypothetical protein